MSGQGHPPGVGESLYRVLGLEPRASREQVERAYRFCLELYGDASLATYSLLEPTQLEAERARVRDAYTVLADAEQRRAYDESHGFEPPEPSPVPFRPPGAGTAGEEAEEAKLPPVLTGADLRRIREARGLTLRHIATVSKIGLRFLEYIEEDRFSLLPASVYLRGFLQEYGRLLGLDPRRTAEAYMSRIPGGT